MAERFAGGFTTGVPGRPVLVQEAAPTFALATAQSIEQWHRQNLQELFDFQKAKDEGCFFIGLYALSAVLHPERALPSANDFLNGIRPNYNEVLEPEKLLVPNHKLAEAFAIYDEWGMHVTRLTRNAKAQEILCENLKGYEEQGLIHDTNSFAPIDITRFNPPYAVWMHEGITNQAHFVTIDGSKEAMDMLNDYQRNKKYFVKMVIEVAPNENPTRNN